MFSRRSYVLGSRVRFRYEGVKLNNGREKKQNKTAKIFIVTRREEKNVCFIHRIRVTEDSYPSITP